MDIDKVAVENGPYAPKTNRASYGNHVFFAKSQIMEALNLCYDRGLIGPNKPPFNKTIKGKKQRKVKVIRK